MTSNDRTLLAVYVSAATARYGFSGGHPFGPDRQEAYLRELARQGLSARVRFEDTPAATEEQLLLFHTAEHVAFVRERCAQARGYLDGGDTPAEPHLFDAALAVVGATLAAVDAVQARRAARAFVPIGGLHHAGRDHAAGFCVFSDIGVAIEHLRQFHGVRRIGYVDIDVHHGDGVFYAYEDDPEIFIADIHQDGRTLYPGTGRAQESGRGAAIGTKLNVPLPPGAGSADFALAWQRVETFIDAAKPEFILFQCGADALAGDPLAGLRLSAADHGRVAARLRALAERHAGGRLVALGGGGYDRANLAAAWCAVTTTLLE